MPGPVRVFFRKAVVYSIENVSLTAYCIIYAATIFLFAVIFWVMPMGNGLISSGQPQPVAQNSLEPENAGLAPLPQTVDFLSSFYFSATTITTVCYGDIDPVGWSRAFASLEALLGLTFFGIMLGKITSLRLSYHVARIFSSQAENRLNEYCLSSRKIEAKLRLLALQVVKAFPETPNTTAAGQAEFLQSFAEVVGELHLFSVNFCRYLDTEADAEFFLADAPEHALAESSEDVQRTIYVLNQLFISLSPPTRVILLDPVNFKRVTEILTRWKKTGAKYSQKCPREEMKDRFKTIRDVSTSLSDSLFSVPVSRPTQPDQKIGNDL